MQVKRAKIIYDYGTVKRIVEHFQRENGKMLTDQTVRNALRFVTTGEQPDEIRRVATEKFGAVLKEEIVEL